MAQFRFKLLEGKLILRVEKWIVEQGSPKRNRPGFYPDDASGEWDRAKVHPHGGDEGGDGDDGIEEVSPVVG